MILAETDVDNAPINTRRFGVEARAQFGAELIHSACPGRVRIRHMGLRGRAPLVSCLLNIDYYWFAIDLHDGGLRWRGRSSGLRRNQR